MTQREAQIGSIRILFSEAVIAARVEALAGEITRTIPGDFVMVGRLKGAPVFVADLARASTGLGPAPRLSSYG